MAPRNIDDEGENAICPVCKSSRYLNPSLKFLINSECYHIMCTSCVDRLFTSGPAPCPVAGCHKTLRKRGFHPAFFADLNIEREVDIRKRVGAIFNRREDDFETLRDWNDYLESIEDLIFKLTEGTPQERKEAEAALKEYKEANQRLIEENERQEKMEEEMSRRAQVAAEERRAKRRADAIRREAEEREDLQRTKAQLIEQLAHGEGDAEEITRKAERIIQQKTERLRGDQAENKGPSLAIRGELKRKRGSATAQPYDAFGGIDLTPTRYVLQKEYDNKWLDGVKNDPLHTVGGYSLQEYYSRAMVDAFAGLAVFVEEEKALDKPLLVHTAAAGGQGTEYDDGF